MDTFTETVFKILSSDADEQTGDIETAQGAVALIEIPAGALSAPYAGPADQADYWTEVIAGLPAAAPEADLPEPGHYVTYLSDAGIITWQGPLTRDDAVTLFGDELQAAAEAINDDE